MVEEWDDEITFPANKYIKNSSAYGTTSTEHVLNADRKTPDFHKASQSPQNDIGQNIEIKI